MKLNSYPLTGRLRSFFAGAAFALMLPGLALAEVISGTVVDATTGAPLVGAVVSGGGESTTTDNFGTFRLNGVPAGDVQLRVTYVGYDVGSQLVNVPQGGVGRTEFFLESQLTELEAFVYQARASAQAQAINLQRSSANLTNVVSADVLGRFPDQNVAESLNRLPGISVERDQGEGRFVVVRGIDPNLNSTAIDGVRLASPSTGERATLLDTIPSDALSRVEVTKAVLPSQPHDSIGGYINIKTPSAFDQDGMTARASGQLNYSDLTNEIGQKVSATWGNQFGDMQQWGFIVSASFGQTRFGSDNIEAEAWSEEDDGIYFNDDEIQPREYNLTRERLGVSANLEYRPDDDTLYFLRGSYNNYQDTEIRHRGTLLFGETGDNEATEDEDEEVDITSFSDITASSYRASDVLIEREMKDREENMRLYAISTGFEKTVGDWDFDATLAFSTAEEDTPYDFEVKYVLGVDSFADETTQADELGENPDFIITQTNTNIPHFAFVPGSGIDPYDPASYEFDEFDTGSQIVEEEDISFEANARYNIQAGLLQYIQGGGAVRFKDKTGDATIAFSDDNPGEFDTLAGLTEADKRDPYDTQLPYITDDYRSLVLGRFDEFAVDFEDEKALIESTFEDFESEEDVYAAYLMASIGNEKHNLILGGRVEHTEFETSGINNEFEPISGESDYTNWLPGLHYRYDISEDLIFRASWTNTIARPSFEQSAPIQEIDGDEVTQGNPALDPYESMNFDASLDYYLPSLGVFSVAVFYKEIENFIFEQEISDTEILLPGDTDPTTVDLTTFNNGDDGEILGLELAYQQQFNMLPSPWDGLGIWANYTITDSEATVQVGDVDADPRTTPFIKQSDGVGTLALTYEKYGFFFRISGSYKSEYLDELGEEAEEDRYIDDFLQWDISTSYQINNQTSIFANFMNINNEPFVATWGDSDRLSQFEEYGWSANLGLKWSY